MGAMPTRRATYRPGNGLLFVARDRLLFLAVAEHAAVPALTAAVQGDCALRSLATAVVSANSEVPPFVFVQHGDDLEGMVVGSIELVLADPESSLVRIDADDSGSQFQASNTSVVSVGGDVPTSMWVEVGVVSADAFRWAAAETAAPKLTPSLAAASDAWKNATVAAAVETVSDIEGDPTIVTLQPLAASMVPVAEPGPGVSASVEAETTIGPAADEPVEDNQPRRTVDARICVDCSHANSPQDIRCRACSTPISGADGESCAIAQPTLGILHLSGGRFEPLDMDLLIGRNPAREPLEPHQRAVVHGQGDRSVSRRHIDVRLDGWRVVVNNLKDDDHTTVESRDGTETPLAPGVSRTLEVGDTVRYGGSWFRYEEGP